MEKLNLHSPDFTQENIAKLAELFPNCVTETREADGNLKQRPSISINCGKSCQRPLLKVRKNVISSTGRASAKPY